MSARTTIEWTERTWNPVRGCSRVSPGCRHCYAEVLAARFSGPGQWGEGFARRVDGRWTGKVALAADHLFDPLRWTRPSRVFVNSTSDLFHEALPRADLDRILAVMLCAPAHTYQVLTKRSDRMREYLSDSGLYDRVLGVVDQEVRPAFRRRTPVGIANPVTHPPSWIWWGVSVENQARADLRVWDLLRTPAARRFVSYEPALGHVDWSAWLADATCRRCSHPERDHGESRIEGCQFVGGDGGCAVICGCRKVRGEADHEVCAGYSYAPHRLDWIIVGGESGCGARPFNVEWARATIAACRTARIAPFVKQLGARPFADGIDSNYFRGPIGADGKKRISLIDPKGGSPREWPEDLRVREYP